MKKYLAVFIMILICLHLPMQIDVYKRQTLSRALEKGEYPAVIKITTTSLTDGSAMNGADVETVLIAQ